MSVFLPERPPGVDDDRGRVRVTSHARLAWLKRINVLEEYPASAIRRAWESSEPVEGHANVRVSDDVYLVYESYREESIILTVYPVEHELGGRV